MKIEIVGLCILMLIFRTNLNKGFLSNYMVLSSYRNTDLQHTLPPHVLNCSNVRPLKNKHQRHMLFNIAQVLKQYIYIPYKYIRLYVILCMFYVGNVFLMHNLHVAFPIVRFLYKILVIKTKYS